MIRAVSSSSQQISLSFSPLWLCLSQVVYAARHYSKPIHHAQNRRGENLRVESLISSSEVKPKRTKIKITKKTMMINVPILQIPVRLAVSHCSCGMCDTVYPGCTRIHGRTRAHTHWRTSTYIVDPPNQVNNCHLQPGLTFANWCSSENTCWRASQERSKNWLIVSPCWWGTNVRAGPQGGGL